MTSETQCPADEVKVSVEIVEHLGLMPGESIDVDFWSNGTVNLHLERRTREVDSVAGLLRDRPRKRRKPLSLKQIKNAIEDGWAERR